MTLSAGAADDELGSLAQSARQKHLKSARNIMFWIGIITILANGVFVFLARQAVEAEFEKEIKRLAQQGMQVDPAEVPALQEAAVRQTQLANGVGVALGVVFCVLAAVVSRIPVPATVLGLVLYVGSAAGFGMLDPSSLIKGFVVKIIIVVALIRAVKSAIAYEQERKLSQPAVE